MKIGIIVALEAEEALLLPLLGDMRHSETHHGVRFCTGRRGDLELVVCRSGIGKVNAAVGALTLIERYRPDAVINTGVAGGLGRARVADVVVATDVAYHDVWCGPGNERGQLQGLPARFTCSLPAARHLLDNRPSGLGAPESAQAVAAPALVGGLLASGDLFVSTPGEVEAIRTLYPEAVAVDMESGAIAQVCALCGVPFVAVRVVSDTPGVTDNFSQYADFWTVAPRATFDVVCRLLDLMAK